MNINGQLFLDASSKFKSLGDDILIRTERIINNIKKIGVENIDSIKLEKSLEYISRFGKLIGLNLSEIYNDIGLNYDNELESKTMVA